MGIKAVCKEMSVPNLLPHHSHSLKWTEYVKGFLDSLEIRIGNQQRFQQSFFNHHCFPTQSFLEK